MKTTKCDREYLEVLASTQGHGWNFSTNTAERHAKAVANALSDVDELSAKLEAAERALRALSAEADREPCSEIGCGSIPTCAVRRIICQVINARREDEKGRAPK